jgi:signal transduction histidine kinase
VIASFLPEDLRKFFQRISVGAHGSVWVFHTSGTVIVHEPSDADPMGTSAADNAIFAAASGDAAGIIEGPHRMASCRQPAARRRCVTRRERDARAMVPRGLGLLMTYTIASVIVTGVLFVLFRQIDANAAAERELLLARQAEAERLKETNEQLSILLEREQAARRDAENANALKDQFVMTVSHELRTPLTAIAGWSRMLVDGLVADDKCDNALQTIEGNAQAQKRLIEDLLDVAGFMAGKLRLDVRPIAVADVIRAAVDAISPASNAKGIHLDVSIDPHAGTISADPGRVQQIVWNLLSNTVKFTPAGGTVSLQVTRRERSIAVRIVDSGAGISSDLLPHVFERFRQGTAGGRRQGGLGLGLAIVRNLVELHGGAVSAASDGEGRGAIFDVVIPVSA